MWLHTRYQVSKINRGHTDRQTNLPLPKIRDAVVWYIRDADRQTGRQADRQTEKSVFTEIDSILQTELLH